MINASGEKEGRFVLVPTLPRGNAGKPLQRSVFARARGTLERLDVLPRGSVGASAVAK